VRFSPGTASSRPPLKKYVTCACFSVSAVCSWRTPCSASTSARTMSTLCSEKATGKSKSSRYFVIVVRSDCSSPSLCESCRRRSGRKLKEIAESDRKSTRLNSSHSQISYAVFCLKKKKNSFDGQAVKHPDVAIISFTF